MLASIAGVTLGMAVTLALAALTSLLDIHPLITGLVIPIFNAALALFLTVAAVRGNAWSLRIYYPLPLLATLHLVKFDAVFIGIFLFNIGLVALSFYLMRRCVAASAG